MDQAAVEQLLYHFAQAQLRQAIQAGHSLSIAPVTTCAMLLQATASTLAQGVDPAATVALLRAYADCIEAGPGDGPAQAAAKAGFDAAAQAMIDTAKIAASFPAPQGSA